MSCGCNGKSGISGYRVLTIDGLGSLGGIGGIGDLYDGLGALGAPAQASGGPASQAGFQHGYEGQGPASKDPAYRAAYQRGQVARKAAPPQPRQNGAAVVRSEDGLPVELPGDGSGPVAPPKGGGGPATVYCAQDTGKGGWRLVSGRWYYAHHEGLILSALAAKFLGDGGAWKLIWNPSRERGLLPNNATPDNIPIRDASGERVLFYMPDQAIEKARSLGCIPASSAGDALIPGGGGLSALPSWVKVAGVAALVGGGLYLATHHD